MSTESEVRLARYKKIERQDDELGRVIGVRRLRPSEQSKLNGMTEDLSGSDIVKAQDTGEDVSLSHRLPLMIAASVCEIDQIVIPFPRTRAELDAIYDRLDVEGLSAAGKALTRLVAGDQIINPVDAAKNSSGTPLSG